MNRIVCGDSITEIKKIDNSSIHLILSDIPYGISLDEWDVLHKNTNSALLGSSPAQKNKAIFSKRGKPLNGWSEADKNISLEYYEWCTLWASDWFRVLKPGASCIVFAGRRYAHRCISALEDAGFIFKDMIAWQKEKAPHRAQNVSSVLDRRNDAESSEEWDGWKLGNLRPLFEPVLWFMKPYPQGETLTDNILEYGVGGYNENFVKSFESLNQGIEVTSNIIKVKSEKKDRGLHPAQKPIALMRFFIGLTTLPGQTVLDPFCGCGTTLVAAKELNRSYIGIEKEKKYCDIIEKRIVE
ncbi:site-specific DNA-methyltransferase [Erysipelothrix rhusiopathiae]|nr:site-specific DNA-methyltransferase [Erysipelothrix rhusiopathiae]